MRITAAILFLPLLTLCAAGCSKDQTDTWTTESGLTITQLIEGEGPPPRRGDTVGVVYRAWFLDEKMKEGKQFDKYLSKEDPYRFRFGRGQVLPGLDETIATMRIGGKRTVVIPPKLAFGEAGVPGTVAPGTWVKFEVELLEITPGLPDPTPWNDAGREIVITDSGLQFVDFRVGEGESPTPYCTIVVHYSGYLDDGSVFDTTRRARPVEFDMKTPQLIPGFREGVMSMKVGGQRKLIIPPELAYGDEGFRKKIPPNATLTYDIELLSVK